MLIYLDMCCLKRPFDDQSQPRIRLESQAVLGVLAIESDGIQFVRSAALVLENSANPVKERAARVAMWLGAGPAFGADTRIVEQRTAELMRLGMKNFDALHVACAEQAGADCFATCDNRLLAVARRNKDLIKTRVMGIVELAREVLQ
jgi:hypothetical protein